MNQSFSIRRFDIKDFDRILALEKECFKDPFDKRFLDRLLQYEHFFLVAEASGSVIGYILSVVQGRQAEIATVAVTPPQRRMGVGLALFNELQKQLRDAGIELLVLEVRVSNSSALNLYRKLGFIMESTIPRFYSDGEDAYFMSKHLNDT